MWISRCISISSSHIIRSIDSDYDNFWYILRHIWYVPIESNIIPQLIYNFLNSNISVYEDILQYMLLYNLINLMYSNISWYIIIKSDIIWYVLWNYLTYFGVILYIMKFYNILCYDIFWFIKILLFISVLFTIWSAVLISPHLCKLAEEVAVVLYPLHPFRS